MQFYEEKIPVKTHVILIDSLQRDVEQYPSPASYVVDLDLPLKNVVAVNLVYAIYERGSTSDKHVALLIPELAPSNLSNSNLYKSAFTVLPVLHTVNTYSNKQHFESVRIFEAPMARLPRLNIRFLLSNGSLAGIGEHLLRFEVECCKYDSSVEARNIEIVTRSVSSYSVSSGTPLLASRASEVLNSDPYSILEIGREYSLDGLISAFRRKKKKLRMQGASLQEHQSATNAFRILMNKFKKS